MVALVSVIAVVTSLAVFAMPLDRLSSSPTLQFETDVKILSTDLRTLGDAIDSFQTTGGSLTGIASIGMNALTVGISLNQLAIDVTNTPSPVDPTTALSILSTIQGIQPVVITALHNVVTAKAAFEALLPGSIGASVINPLAAAALTAVETLFNGASNGLIGLAPDDLRGVAIDMQTAMATSFNTAIATFSPLL